MVMMAKIMQMGENWGAKKMELDRPQDSTKSYMLTCGTYLLEERSCK